MTSSALEAYKFAADVSKQLLTLGTALVTLAIAFANLSKATSPRGQRALVLMSGTVLLSVVFGIMTLMAIAGHLGTDSAEGIYAPGIRLYSGLQQVAFLLGLALAARYASVVLHERATLEAAASSVITEPQTGATETNASLPPKPLPSQVPDSESSPGGPSSGSADLPDPQD